MQKSSKRKWMWFGVVIVLIILILGLYPLRMSLETQKMSPLATKEIVPGVFSVKDSYVNLFLVKGVDGYIAVDAGNSLKQVRQEMKKLALDPQKVVAVFLTHTDFDHTAALGLFTNAKIYLSKAEEQMINGKTPRFFVISNKKIAQYELLDDSQTVAVDGLKVQGIAVPGHTPGAMSYVINDSALFVGDAMSLKNGKADIFNEFFNMDTATQRQSIRKLAALPNIKYIFTAHYGFTDDFAKAFGSR